MTMGRPKKSQEQLDRDADVCAEICARLSRGETLNAICRDVGMPSVRTVNDWRADRPDFAAMFARARDDGFDAIASQCLEIADTPIEGERRKETEDGVEVVTEDMLGHRRLQVETRLKLLAKWDPRRYGDKLAVGGADDLPPLRSESLVTLDPSEAYKLLLGGK